MDNLVALCVTIMLLHMVVLKAEPEYGLDLNPWLHGFQQCNIRIMILEKNIELNKSDYPISIAGCKDCGPNPPMDTRDGGKHFDPSKLAPKHLLCTAQLFVLTKYETLVKHYFTYRPARLAESIGFPNLGCSTILSKSFYSWTNCVVLIVGISSETWSRFMQFSNYFYFIGGQMLTEAFGFGGLPPIQYFVLLVQERQKPHNNRTELDIERLEYVCTICWSRNESVATFPVPNVLNEPTKLRLRMEKAVVENTRDGRDFIFGIKCYLDTIEIYPEFQLPAGSYKPRDGGFVSWTMTLRQYYLKESRNITFPKVILHILFETVPGEVIERVMGRNVSYFRPAGDWSTVAFEPYAFSHYERKLYLGGKESFNFVSCFGLKNTASLAVYAEPFDGWTWLSLISVLISVTVISTITVTLLFGNGGTLYVGNLFFYTISTVLDNSVGNLTPPFKQKMAHTLRVTFFVLSIVCTLPGNIYKGIITRNIISPLPNTIAYEKINQLEGFSFAALPKHTYRRSQSENIQVYIMQNIDFNLSSIPRKQADMRGMITSFGEELLKLFHSGDLFHAASNFSWFHSIEDYYSRILIFGNEEQAEAFIGDCSEKRAFVGLQSEISDFMKTMDSEDEVAYGKDSFLPVNYYWQIPFAAGGYLHRRMSSILSSGIGGMWEGIYYSKTRSELNPSLKVTTGRFQTLAHTNLGALFKLHLILLGIATAIFISELVVAIIRKKLLRFQYPTRKLICSLVMPISS